MKYTSLLPALSLVPLIAANNWASGTDALTPTTISAKGINATFIGYGARITSLFVEDKNGDPKDIVVGYDDPAQYVKDSATNHTYFGTIVGRYANRIKNGTFELDGEEWHIPTNEHGGLNTLHGGFIGYDQLNWTLTHSNASSLTYTLLDPAGRQGFPGTVLAHVTYTVSDCTDTSRGKFTARIVALALDHATPIMLSTHIYWNLGAFESPTVLNNTLQLPYAKRYIAIDGIQIPTGETPSVSGTALDYTSPKQLTAALDNVCGDGCIGLDNAFILDRPENQTRDSIQSNQLIWSSDDTGLTMRVKTNQQSFQVYSCVGQNGTVYSHGNAVEKYGCLVIEPQGWIDGINNPQWNQTANQIYSSASLPNVNWAEYDFSV